MIKNILTIAGSDSGGGAGIQADLKTITMLGQYGGSVVTSVTAQNTQGVQAAFAMTPEMVAAQFDAVCSDITFAAAKTGMLANGEIVEVVAAKIKAYQLPKVVVDPVMVATSGDVLLKNTAVANLVELLLPQAYLVTPNMSEAAILSGQAVDDLGQMKEAAQKIWAMGPQYVLVKGGHLSQGAIDILYDGKEFTVFSEDKIATKNTHGTGCTLSAAIAANLGAGMAIKDAIRMAKDYLTACLRNSGKLAVGSGNGPLCHNYALIEAGAW